jgi:putrescine aminotransferase
VGYNCRVHCFANNLVMRHVGDRMIISPPLVMQKSDVDTLIERATRALDLTLAQIKAEDLYK